MYSKKYLGTFESQVQKLKIGKKMGSILATSRLTGPEKPDS